MKYLIYFLTIVFLLSLNVAVFSFLKVEGIVPNLLLLLVIIFSLGDQSYDFFFIASLSGIFLDFFSPLYFGSFSFSLIFLAFGLHLLVHNVFVFEINWKYLSAILTGSLLLVLLFIWGYNTLFFRLGFSSTYIDFKFFENRFLKELIYNWLLLFPIRKLVDFVKLVNLKLSARQSIL